MSPISFNPEHFSKGGGLADDFDGEITDARIDIFTYQGKGKPAVGLILDIKTDEGEELEQFYSIGDEQRWSPSSDGSSVIGNDGQQSINEGCNAALFFAHLVDCGFPPDKLEDDDVTVMEGLKGHFKRVPQPKRTGLSGSADGREKTLLTVSEIYGTRFDKKGGSKGRGKRAAKGKASRKSSDNGDEYADAASALVMEVLSEHGTATKKELSQAAFKTITNDMAQRKAVVKLVFNDDFLGGEHQPWEFDDADGSVSM